MRLFWGPFSDQRNCQTSGPYLRTLLIRLPCCILGLRDRSCGAQGFSRIGDTTRGGESVGSQVNCFAAAMLPLGRYVPEARFWIASGWPTTQTESYDPAAEPS